MIRNGEKDEATEMYGMVTAGFRDEILIKNVNKEIANRHKLCGLINAHGKLGY